MSNNSYRTPDANPYQVKADAQTVMINKKWTWRRLLRYVLQYRWHFLVALLLTLVGNGLALVGPWLSGKAIDSFGIGVGMVDFPAVYGYFFWMIGFYTLSGIFLFILNRLMIVLSQKIVAQMRQQVFEKMGRLPVHYFDQHQTGDLISRLTYDIDTINTSLSQDLIQLVTMAIIIVGSLSMMLGISPLMVSVFLITIPLSFLYTRYMSKKTRPLFRKRSATLGELNGFAEEMVSAQAVIKSYHQEKEMIIRFQEKNKCAVSASYDAEYYSSTVGPTMNFITNITLALIAVVGAIWHQQGGVSIGEISAFIMYGRRFSGPINQISTIIAGMQSSLSAAERVFQVLDAEEEIADSPTAKPLTDCRGKVVFEKVQFGYESNHPVIQDLDISVEPGQVVAIVGHTGAGKTTLMQLLMRFYDPQKGRILIDDVDIRDYTRTSLRQSFAMVLQETWLFRGSIYENIAYGREHCTREQVIAAAKAANIHPMIERLPNAYDTLLVEDTLNLSKGQKQLLTMARAMVAESKMLILDEATSNVDTATELDISHAMKRLMKGKTCFVIAHRLSTIRNADLILVLDKGRIVEKGTHEQLASAQGTYAAMLEASKWSS